MKQIPVIFWTGTGNTQMMADAIAEAINAAGAEAVVKNVSEITADEAAGYDALALGCPAMGAEVLEECEFEPFFTELEGKLAEIEQSKADALVDAAITEGKVAPADKAMYVGLCSTEAGREQFTAWCSRAPVIADASQVSTTTQQNGELSKDELAMCRMMNVKPETWKATKAAQKAK